MEIKKLNETLKKQLKEENEDKKDKIVRLSYKEEVEHFVSIAYDDAINLLREVCDYEGNIPENLKEFGQLLIDRAVYNLSDYHDTDLEYSDPILTDIELMDEWRSRDLRYPKLHRYEED